jgi:hypothetical protein
VIGATAVLLMCWAAVLMIITHKNNTPAPCSERGHVPLSNAMSASWAGADAAEADGLASPPQRPVVHEAVAAGAGVAEAEPREAAGTHFVLGQLGPLGATASECHSSVSGSWNATFLCNFRHACWSSTRPTVLSVLPQTERTDPAAVWPDPWGAQSPHFGPRGRDCALPCNHDPVQKRKNAFTPDCPQCFEAFHFEIRDAVRPPGLVVLVDGATVLFDVFQDHLPNFANVRYTALVANTECV